MRRKAMMRILALAAAVMMTVTGIPTTAFTASAAEADPAVEYAAEDAGEADEEEEVLPEDGADGADDAGGQEETPDVADGGEEGNGEEEGAGGEPDAAAAEGGAENPEADGAGSGDDASDDSGSGNDGGQPEGQSGGNADAQENGADTGNNPDQSTDPSASGEVTGSDNADTTPGGQELTEEERLEKEEADRLEKERIEKEEAERLEKERIEKEEAERLEKERIEKEEAERLEKERLEKEEAERLAAEQAEKERLEKEAAEKAAEAEKMPADTLIAEATNIDMKVRIDYDEGIFPKDTAIRIRQVTDPSIVAAAQEVLPEDQEIVDFIAVDISFFVVDENGRREVKPTDPEGVHVTLTTKRQIEGEQHTVIHMKDSETAETVAEATADGASFDSVGFSVYAIVGYDGYTEGDVPRNIYKFYTETPESGEGNFVLWDEQILKDGESLVRPGIPDGPDEHCCFVGWFMGKDHESGEGDEARLTFDQPVSVTGTEDTIIEVHAHFEKEYLVFFYNAAGTDVIDEKEFEWDPAVNGPDNPVTVSLSGPRPQLAAGETFLGWIAKDADPTDMTEATYPVDGTISITSSENVELKALVKQAYKITFEGNGGDDIVTFTEPIMVLPGQRATQPTNPTRDGYTFTGWYTTAAATGTAFNWNQAINQDYTLYAGWRGNTNTPYTIYIWREIMVDGDPNNTHYELVLEQTDTATTGSTVNWATQKRTAFENSSAATSSRSDSNAFDYRYYEFDTSQNVPTVIKGDGSTIVNAYYNLRTFTIEFNLGTNNNVQMTVNGTTYRGGNNQNRYTL